MLIKILLSFFIFGPIKIFAVDIVRLADVNRIDLYSGKYTEGSYRYSQTSCENDLETCVLLGPNHITCTKTSYGLFNCYASLINGVSFKSITVYYEVYTPNYGYVVKNSFYVKYTLKREPTIDLRLSIGGIIIGLVVFIVIASVCIDKCKKRYSLPNTTTTRVIINNPPTSPPLNYNVPAAYNQPAPNQNVYNPNLNQGIYNPAYVPTNGQTPYNQTAYAPNFNTNYSPAYSTQNVVSPTVQKY